MTTSPEAVGSAIEIVAISPKASSTPMISSLFIYYVLHFYAPNMTAMHGDLANGVPTCVRAQVLHFHQSHHGRKIFYVRQLGHEFLIAGHGRARLAESRAFKVGTRLAFPRKMDLFSAPESTLFKIGYDFWDDFSKPEQQHLNTLFEDSVVKAFRDGYLGETLKKALSFDERHASSWIHREAPTEAYWSLAVIGRVGFSSPASQTWTELWQIASDPTRLLMPYDFRALMLETILENCSPELVNTLLSGLDSIAIPALPIRRAETFYGAPGDGIDHLFQIPETRSERAALLTFAAITLNIRHVATLLNRAQATIKNENPESSRWSVGPALSSATVLAAISEDVRAELIAPRDYLVAWAAEISFGEQTYTVAELLRIVAMTEISALPDLKLRNLCVSFYRAVLKISGRSTIGLSAKIFHVEHGIHAEASIFFLGRDAVLGKGLAVDVVGGFAVLSGAFLGGGYMPILIHTHKHIRTVSTAKATGERKKILPACFLARANTRLPMAYVGLWETADFLDKASPIAGIESCAVAAFTARAEQ